MDQQPLHALQIMLREIFRNKPTMPPRDGRYMRRADVLPQG